MVIAEVIMAAVYIIEFCSSRDGLYLLFYVDDMLIITCKHREDIERLTTQLSSEFEIKNLGATSRILGMQIVKKVINRFAMGYSKPLSTPLATHFRLSKQQEPIEDVDVAYIKNIPFLVLLEALYMLCFASDLTYHMVLVLLVDLWGIQVKNIRIL